MWNQVKSKRREIKEGRRIWLLNSILNNSLKIPKGTFGKVVHVQNQVEAEIWYKDDFKIAKPLELDTSVFVKNRFCGIVLETKVADFAMVYNINNDAEIMIYEDKLYNIPFLDLEGLKAIKGRLYMDNTLLNQYRVADLIERIEETFSQWVSELDVIENVDEESENVYEFTANAQKKFTNKQNEIIESFAMATGLYYEFKGGTLEY